MQENHRADGWLSARPEQARCGHLFHNRHNHSVQVAKHTSERAQDRPTSPIDIVHPHQPADTVDRDAAQGFKEHQFHYSNEAEPKVSASLD